MFLVIPALVLPLIGANAAGPAIAATPDSASAGHPIVVRGSDFPTDLPIVLTWDGEPLGPPKAVPPGGEFEAIVTVPDGSAPGEHTLAAGTEADSTDGSGPATTEVASTSITVVVEEEPAPPTLAPIVQTPPPTPEPTPEPTAATPEPPPEPTAVPPTATPTAEPTATATPTSPPTATPTVAPTATPTAAPTATPTAPPTATAPPTPSPTTAPTATAPPTATPPPTPVPTPNPTATPPPTPAPQPAPTASPPPPKTPCADGKWFAQYYDEMSLSPGLLKKTRCEPRARRGWGLHSPGFGLRSNWFSVRFTKRASFKTATYTFKYSADNGLRVYVDGVRIIDRWAAGGSGSVTRSMKAGLHIVKVEYFEDAGSAAVALTYKATGPAAAPGATPGPTTPPAPTAPPTPTSNPGPTATPAPTPNPTPGPPATPPPGLPSPVSCSTALSTLINNAAAGSTLNLGSCVYTSAIDIRKPIRLYGGTFRLPIKATAIHINANDVTIESVRFEGGGYVVTVYGRDRVKILNSSFTGMGETSINLSGPSVDDALIQGNTIIQRVVTGHGYSPISGQGYGRGMNRNLVIRNNTIDQGPSGVAWFGVEVWDNIGLVIEGNLLKGASALVSIPRSDGAIVRNNRFDMTQAFWGIELADVSDAQVYGNTVWGNSGSNGPDGRAFVQMHPGCCTVDRNVVRNNNVSRYWAIVNAAGAGHTITNNCMTDVRKVYAFSFTGPVTVSGNGPCP